jgi:hypothetical protein
MLESGFGTAKVVREGKGRETKQPKSETHGATLPTAEMKDCVGDASISRSLS